MTLSMVAKSREEAAREVEAFRSLMTATRLERGCLRCAVGTADNENIVLRYEEEWASEADLRRRVRSERFTAVLALLETSSEPPHVQFDFASRTCGLEYVEAVRDVAR